VALGMSSRKSSKLRFGDMAVSSGPGLLNRLPGSLGEALKYVWVGDQTTQNEAHHDNIILYRVKSIIRCYLIPPS
jgi:hypothetical protein